MNEQKNTPDEREHEEVNTRLDRIELRLKELDININDLREDMQRHIEATCSIYGSCSVEEIQACRNARP